MNITFLSDTHTFHQEILSDWLPGGDVICHSGDFCLRGDFQEAISFFEWFSKLNYTHKIFIAGNHDICFDNNHQKNKYFKEMFNREKEKKVNDIRELIPENLIYLENSEVVIDGVKFWGAPQTPYFHNWAFNVQRGKALKEIWQHIPNDADVILTHGPVYDILDATMRQEKVGDKELLEVLNEVKPKIHSFGHIHEAYGSREVGDTLFLNSSVVNLRYWLANKPHVVEDFKLKTK